MAKKLTQEEFIERAKAVHGDRYDYSKVEYVNTTTEVDITCPKHGVFPQIPKSHLIGKGCKSCSVARRSNALMSTKEHFLEKATLRHGSRYDYSKVDYRGNDKDVVIICSEHGEFKQMPSVHYRGGCPDCGLITIGNLKRLPLDDFISRSKLVHGGKYDYSHVVYKTNDTAVTITCKEHGNFPQIPSDHLDGHGCPHCAGNALSNTEKFVALANNVHGVGKWDYSLVNYTGAKGYVKIICKEHGEFPQTPNNHLNGQGCPECSNFGFDKKLKSVVYVYNSEKFVGFGITKNITKRDSQHQKSFSTSGVVAELYRTYTMSGSAAVDIERAIKSHFKIFIIDTGITGFRKEAIVPEQLYNLIGFIENKTPPTSGGVL